MKIAVVGGAGAMESALGEARNHVARTVRVPATTAPAAVGDAYLVIVFAKCYHTA